LEKKTLFIKFSRLEMSKLVYLEFRLGLKIPCPRVKRGVLRIWSSTIKTEANASSLAVFLKMYFKLRSALRKKIQEL